MNIQEENEKLHQENKELSGYCGGLAAIIVSTATHRGSFLRNDTRVFLMEQLIKLSSEVSHEKGDGFDKQIEEWKRKLATLKNQN